MEEWVARVRTQREAMRGTRAMRDHKAGRVRSEDTPDAKKGLEEDMFARVRKVKKCPPHGKHAVGKWENSVQHVSNDYTKQKSKTCQQC